MRNALIWAVAMAAVACSADGPRAIADVTSDTSAPDSVSQQAAPATTLRTVTMTLTDSVYAGGQPLPYGVKRYYELDQVITLLDTVLAFPYPADSSHDRGGEVVVEFIVRPTGRVDALTIRVLEATSEAFAESARLGLLGLRFSPPNIGGTLVSQMVGYRISFAAPE